MYNISNFLSKFLIHKLKLNIRWAIEDNIISKIN